MTAEYSISPAHIAPKFQWYYNDENSTAGGTLLEGETGQIYTIGDGLIGKYIYVTVTAEDENYVTKVVSDITDEENNGTAAVAKAKLTIPTALSITYGYTGDCKTLELNNFNEDIMNIENNTATEIGTYTATITLKNTISYEWIDGTSREIQITWNINNIKKGDFIEYGIEYTDVYTGYKYSGDEGWRLLSKTDNEDGTSNIEIISTGIPAKLYYYYAAIGSAAWCANTTQINQYVSDYYISLESKVGNPNMLAAAGLLYNFEKIVFSQGTGTPAYNKGLYTAISGNQDTGTGLFKANNISKDMLSVRSVMHTDLKPSSAKTDIGFGYTYTDAAKGLFTLQNLAIDPHNSGYYLLASPQYDGYNSLRLVRYDGYIDSHDGTAGPYSVRPVVSISGIFIDYENGMWKIKTRKVLQKPISNNHKYTGDEKSISLTNYNSEYMEITGTTNATEIGTYKVTVSLKNTSKYCWPDGLSEPLEIEWKIEDIAKGDFIEYGIEYTDVYTGYKYSGDEGWRLLSKTDNEDGTSNIEIISTGIPAKLYYYYAAIGSAAWCANTTQINQYVSDYYISLESKVGNPNMLAAAGLLYNFEKIVFSQGTGTPAYNKGLYTAISGNQDTGTGLFKANNISKDMLSVRSVMHTDLKPSSAKTDIGFGYTYTDAAKGLFTLQNLAIDPHNSGYYLLASPQYDGYNSLRLVRYDGYIDSHDGTAGPYSVRPVVSISGVYVDYENEMWKINIKES